MTGFLDRISITQQFMLMVVMALGLMASGTGMALKHSYDLDRAARQTEIRNLAEAGRSIAQAYLARAESGAMTRPAAQAAALTAIAAMQYGEGNYLFIVTDDGTVLADANKDWIGTNQMNAVDAQGQPICGR